MEDIILETDRLWLRTLKDGDQDYIVTIAEETGLVKALSASPSFLENKLQICWNAVWDDSTYTMLVFLRGTEELVGKICMQHIGNPVPELGIDILFAYHNQGYGPETIKSFCSWYMEKYSVREIRVRIREENTHSIHVFEKLGAKYIGASPYYSENFINRMRQAFPNDDLSDITRKSIREYVLGYQV